MATQTPTSQQREQPRPPFPPQHQDKPGSEAELRPRPHYEAPAYKLTGKRALSKEEVFKFGGQTPLGRPAQPEELAPAYVFLASEADSSYISGIVLPVLGGETIGG